MAEIKGLTLKNVTHFKGHEGEPCRQGSLYYKGKKVGYYSDSFSMGQATIDFNEKETEDAVKADCKAYYEERPDERWFENSEPDMEEYLAKLFSVMDYEKEYKKCVKQGFPIFVTYRDKSGVEYMTGFKTVDYGQKRLAMQEEISQLRFYTDLSDFIIK